MSLYDYQPNELHATLHLKRRTAQWLHYVVEFPTLLPNRLEDNNVVRGEYYRPGNRGAVPLVILVHGMGDRSVIPCQILARSLVKKGIACFILYLVFHSSRMRESIRNHFPHLTEEEWYESYRVSVINIRQVLDWSHNQAELNKEKIAILGISFGGSVSAIAMGIDKRIKAGVFIVTGGNSEKIIWLSKSNRDRTKYYPTEAEYKRIQSSYASYLAQVSEHGFENVAPARQSFLTDPMTFSTYLRQRPVFMINALWDTYVPREAATDFWQACGEPKIRWFAAGHSSIWLWYPVISKQIADFVRLSLFDN